jgi:hypothetical protein
VIIFAFQNTAQQAQAAFFSSFFTASDVFLGTKISGLVFSVEVVLGLKALSIYISLTTFLF